MKQRNDTKNKAKQIKSDSGAKSNRKRIKIIGLKLFRILGAPIYFLRLIFHAVFTARYSNKKFTLVSISFVSIRILYS